MLEENESLMSYRAKNLVKRPSTVWRDGMEKQPCAKKRRRASTTPQTSAQPQGRLPLLAPASSAKVELIEKKSRFIGHVAPAFSVYEAETFIENVREEHKTATHNVYSYVIHTINPHETSSEEEAAGKVVEKASDDGEPRGTAGYPVLHAIREKGFTNAVCVVTRYFGGILLGANGLIRAYSRTAALALDKAGRASYAWRDLIKVTLDYQFYEKVKHYLEIIDKNYAPQEPRFETKITFSVYVEPEKITYVSTYIKDLTQGTAEISVSPGRYMATS